MPLEISRISESIDSATLETVAGIIWNASRLKLVISLMAENPSFRQKIKLIDDIPLELIISQSLYKLNGEIRRTNEEHMSDILGTLASSLEPEDEQDPTFNKME